MRVPKGLQKLLANFVFRDCRIESHPKVLSSHVYFGSGESHLDLVARVSKNAIPFGDHRIDADRGVTGYAWRKKQVVLMSEISQPDPLVYKADFLTGANVQSFLAVPIGDGSDVIGVLNMLSAEKGFFKPRDTGRLQLFGALIAFIHAQGQKRIANTEAANRLGRALSGVRAELGLTQDELAYRGGFSRIALSQWERGRWPPSMGPIFRWCAALGLVAEEDEPQVSFLDVTPQLIVLLRDNPNELRNLSPERFEDVIAERIDRMGYDV
jgi:transcriptional regulator with XRE-family HTH domain